jgi:hypothetical protein
MVGLIEQGFQWIYVIGFWFAFSDYEENGWIEGDNEAVHYLASIGVALFWPLYLFIYLVAAHEARRYSQTEEG